MGQCFRNSVRVAGPVRKGPDEESEEGWGDPQKKAAGRVVHQHDGYEQSGNGHRSQGNE